MVGFLWFVVVVLVFFLFGLAGSVTTAEEKRKAAESENIRLNQEAAKLRSEVEYLSKYRHIIDVEAEAKRIEDNALNAAAGIEKEAASILRRAKGEVMEAHREIADTNVEKKKIEAAIEALRHTFEGYGPDYLVPTQTLVDGLVDEFGYQDAGVELKKARDISKALVKKNRAVACDSNVTRFKETCVALALDAFNRKFDDIIRGIKNENYGVLAAMLKDACDVVNGVGIGLQNTRIEKEYLNSRLSELKWAAVAYEFKQRMQEEQREKREQERDEEKARKEREKEIKDSEKEEAAVKKALDKMKLEMDKASDEQLAGFEAKYQELQLKLQETIERTQRTKSQAELTKAGHVYIISNEGSFGLGVIKIGMTRRKNYEDRVKELGDASVPFGFDIHAAIYSENAPALEKSLHAHFIQGQLNKVNPRKEFFRAPIANIRKEIEALGYRAEWMMTAAALEYRETQALEKSFKEDPKSYEKWLSRQRKVMTERLWDSDEADELDFDEEEAKPVKKTRVKKSA